MTAARHRALRRLWPVAALTLSTCGPPGPAPLFPEDYLASYQEVRNCRSSGDHDLNQIRILASPEALGPYLGRDGGFPEGAVVLKQEFDFADTRCAGPITQWTVMKREAGATATLGWRWQIVDAERRVQTQDSQRCVGCHQGCGGPPDGYEGTCAVP